MLSRAQSDSGSPRALPLSQLHVGARCTVCPHTDDCASDVETLRAMGLRVNATVRVCRCGDPFIVDVRHAAGGGCRIGLSRRLAQRLMVSPINA
jgi:Fe2+ transport system protein FeoA